MNQLISLYRTQINRLVTVATLLFVFPGLTIAGPDIPGDKLTVEEIIARHLSSIGKAEDIAAAKTRVINGQHRSLLKASNSMVEVVGVVQFASDGEKVLLVMLFNANNYPYEKFAYDGSKFTVATLPTGGRSPLTNFLVTQDVVFKHGLIGGALSSAWPLAALDSDKGKLSYGGSEHIDGREVHKLKYQPKKGDVRIALYFDAETFRHVRSEYEYTITGQMGPRPGDLVTGPSGTGGARSRYKVTEEFSVFKTNGKLTLPTKYKIQYVSDTSTLDYNITLSQFVFDQAIDSKAFRISSAE